MLSDSFTTFVSQSPTMELARTLRAANIYPYQRQMEADGTNHLKMEGRRYLNISSSSYLGLQSHPDVQAAAMAALDRYGPGANARILNGSRPIHAELEEALAAFLGKEAAIVFPTGYAANLGGIPALIGRGDVAICDAEVHACLLDGVKLSGADFVRFRHNDMDHLEKRLKDARGRKRLVVVDAVYSMSGDVADVGTIVDLCERHGAWLFLDDAHGIGVLGDGGRGTAHAFQVADRVPVIMGVLGKALGSVGGFIAGSHALIDYLRHTARTYLFSAALSPVSAAASLAALRVLQREPHLPRRPLELAERARNRFMELGFDCGASRSHIVPLYCGSNMRALAFWRGLEQQGVWSNPVFRPAVPPGRELLRNTFPASLDEQTFDAVLRAFGQLACEVNDSAQARPDEPALSA